MTTTKTTTKTTKNRKAKERRLSYDPTTRHLTISVDGDASGYWVDVIAVTDCGHQFELLKDRQTRQAGSPTCYSVCVADDAEAKLCDCKGFEFRRSCRHVDALSCLLGRGHFQS